MFFPVTGISSNDECVRSEMQFTTLSQTRKVLLPLLWKKNVLPKFKLPGKDEPYMALTT